MNFNTTGNLPMQQMLAQYFSGVGGQSSQPQHWTQALASVLGNGLGVYYGGKAATTQAGQSQKEAEAKAKALATALGASGLAPEQMAALQGGGLGFDETMQLAKFMTRGETRGKGKKKASLVGDEALDPPPSGLVMDPKDVPNDPTVSTAAEDPASKYLAEALVAGGALGGPAAASADAPPLDVTAALNNPVNVAANADRAAAAADARVAPAVGGLPQAPNAVAAAKVPQPGAPPPDRTEDRPSEVAAVRAQRGAAPQQMGAPRQRPDAPGSVAAATGRGGGWTRRAAEAMAGDGGSFSIKRHGDGQAPAAPVPLTEGDQMPDAAAIKAMAPGTRFSAKVGDQTLTFEVQPDGSVKPVR